MAAGINRHDTRDCPSGRVEKEQIALERPHRRRKNIQVQGCNLTVRCGCGFRRSFERDYLKLVGIYF